MKRIQLLAPLFGLALGVGCQSRAVGDRDHARKDDRADTRGGTLTNDESRGGGVSVPASRPSERMPVSGRNPLIEDDEHSRDNNRFLSNLRDQLGDDWRLEKHASSWVAVRRNNQPAGDKLNKKANDLIRELKKAPRRNLNVMYSGGSEVILRGSAIEHCDDGVYAANKFADIDGINRIVIEMSCLNTNTQNEQ